MTTARVRAEWQARVAAEYTSATITQHLVLWLMQAGAPPDLLDDGLAIVADELVHARMSHEVHAAAGGVGAPALVEEALGLARARPRLLEDILRAGVRVFCLGETVAVPLFRHLREGATVPAARAALDRILRDEVRHRDFGWDLLDWLGQTALGPEVPALVTADLPAMFAELHASYGLGNDAVAGDPGDLADEERGWGLASPRDYAGILARTIEREYVPRFAARGIDATGARRA